MNKLAIIAAGALVLTSACSASAAPSESPDYVAATLPVAAASPSVATAPATPAPAPASPPPAASAATPAPSTATAPAQTAASGLSQILARGKKVYETAGEVGCTDCHGPEGKGGITKTGDSSPDIRGATEAKLRAALGGGAALMSYIKLTDSEIDAVIAYLAYLNR